MPKTIVCDGNEAAAWGVARSRPDMVAVYPITPQSSLAEYISQFVADGIIKADLMGRGGDVYWLDMGQPLRIGDLVWFRHAKSGELAEHVRDVHLVSGDRVVDVVDQPVERHPAHELGVRVVARGKPNLPDAVIRLPPQPAHGAPEAREERALVGRHLEVEGDDRRPLREEERLRISREIHDDLGQKLTGLKMQLRLLEEQLDGRGDRSLNPLLDALVDASTTADEAIDSVRRIASGLRPLALDHLGLDTALREEAEQFTRRTGIPCRLDSGPMDEEIPPAARIAAFRIFQECLTNVARHAGVKVVEVRCAAADGSLTLDVRDHGAGFDLRKSDAAGASSGLSGMRERAAFTGGRLVIKTAPGAGTRVIATLPLHADAAGGTFHFATEP